MCIRDRFKASAARSRRINRRTRKQFFRAYASTVNSSTPVSSVHKKVRKISRKHHADPPIILVYGPQTSDVISAPGIVADELGYHFASCSSGSRYPEPFRSSRLRVEFPDFSVPPGTDLPYLSLIHI